jgi:hypothetical protein
VSTLANRLLRRSLFQRTTRRLIKFFDTVLPDWIFTPAYKALFSFYSLAINLLYLRFLVISIVTGNKYKTKKILTIFHVMPYSLVGWRGLESTYDAVHSVLAQNIPGSLVECGVARGGSAALMGVIMDDAPDRTLWLFDSYEGLPEPGVADFCDGATGSHIRPLPKGSCLGTYEAVEDLLFSKLRLSRDHVFMVKGWFQDSLPSYSGKIGDISVLRIDADWYDSVRCCFEALYDHVVPRGFVIIDDYGTCFGARKYVDEFLASRKLAVSLVPDGRGGVYFQKPLTSRP